MQTIRVFLRRLLSITRREVDMARRDLYTAQRERDDAHTAADAAVRRLAHVQSLLKIETNSVAVDSQTTKAEIRYLEDEWCVVGQCELCLIGEHLLPRGPHQERGRKQHAAFSSAHVCRMCSWASLGIGRLQLQRALCMRRRRRGRDFVR
eukprot:scaffold5171_cov126-Isochrysis_galbana.AAC.7